MYKRIISVLTFYNGALYRTKNFVPDYQYTLSFVDLWSIDEIIILNISQDRKNSLANFVSAISQLTNRCFVPITMGGGISFEEDARLLFEQGADKIVLNSALINDPELITRLVKIYGSQSIVASIDYRKSPNDKSCMAYINNGKKLTSYTPLALALYAERLGVGELLLNCIDHDGALIGYDDTTLSEIVEHVTVPVIISGGAGNWKHFEDGIIKCGASGVCTSNIYHFTETSIKSAKQFLNKKGISLRE